MQMTGSNSETQYGEQKTPGRLVVKPSVNMTMNVFESKHPVDLLRTTGHEGINFTSAGEACRISM